VPPPSAPDTLVITTFNDAFKISVEIQGQCPCELPTASDRIENSTQCSSAGVRECGICVCHEGHYGKKCQCSSDTESDNSEDVSDCLADPGNPELCSGQGHCECGECVCHQRQIISGKFCECNSELCRSSSGASCSGMGSCRCGACLCLPGRVGRLCQCPDDTSCQAPGDSLVCSGKGSCVCGQCSCDTIDDVLYTGRYCEDCSTCSSGKCLEMEKCVHCLVHRKGQGQQCTNCTIVPIVLHSLDAQVAAGSKFCSFTDTESGCDFAFTYEYRASTRDYAVFARKDQQCPEKLDVVQVVLGSVGAVVALGLLTLILWKILTSIHDRKEYQKFEKESKNVQFGVGKNPLFVPATVNIENPSFNVRGSMRQSFVKA